MEPFTVCVPGSTSNLGAGFDTVSAALSLALRVDVRPTQSAQVEWLEPRPAPQPNLLLQALDEAARRLGQDLPGLRLSMDNPIPLQRGLGSSGAAIIAGIKIVEHCCGVNLDSAEILNWALPLEGHPDNLAASLLGGWVLSRVDGLRVHADRIEAKLKCNFVVAVPEITVSTRRAREILPQGYPLEDAVFNLQRCALLIHALYSDRPDLLREALQDRLHQPYRQALVPGLSALLQHEGLPDELEPHFFGVALSGSGSSVVALSRPGFEDAIGAWMEAVLRASGTEVRILNLKLDTQGARVVGQRGQ